ncbi:cytochrome D1 domain-containing protein [Candidatus Uabimicrobium sp. HlEnr_7]|uniref:cytochrome D1 domain-containing protein n=1 Tax=Candidatus Uabimicrobium helgolandensis TaxID=3095367 RepID=UPI003556F151
MQKKMILFIFGLLTLIYADEIVVWQAFSKNERNTNYDLTLQSFNLQGRVTASKNIVTTEAVFYRYQSETRKVTLDLYYKEKNDAIFQGQLTVEANETDLIIVATLDGGSKFTKRIQLGNFGFIKNPQFEDYDFITSKKIHKDKITSMAFTRNSRYLVTGADDNYARIMDARTLKIKHNLRGHSGYVKSIAITRDDKYVLSGGKDGTMRVWDIETGKKIKVIQAHKNAVNAIAISNSGKYAVTGSKNARVTLWDLTTYKKVLEYPDSSSTREYLCLAFSSDDRFVLTGDNNKKATILNAIEGTYVKNTTGSGPITALAMTRNMRHLYTGDTTGRVKWVRSLLQPNFDDPHWRGQRDVIWTAFFKRDQIDIDEFKSSSRAYNKIYYGHPIRGYESSIVCLNLSGNGKFIMYAEENGRLRISDVDSGFRRFRARLYSGLSAGTLSYDGKLTAIGEIRGKINIYGLP